MLPCTPVQFKGERFLEAMANGWKIWVFIKAMSDQRNQVVFQVQAQGLEVLRFFAGGAPSLLASCGEAFAKNPQPHRQGKGLLLGVELKLLEG